MQTAGDVFTVLLKVNQDDATVTTTSCQTGKVLLSLHEFSAMVRRERPHFAQRPHSVCDKCPHSKCPHNEGLFSVS